jgi:hypothetical protein
MRRLLIASKRLVSVDPHLRSGSRSWRPLHLVQTARSLGSTAPPLASCHHFAAHFDGRNGAGQRKSAGFLGQAPLGNIFQAKSLIRESAGICRASAAVVVS